MKKIYENQKSLPDRLGQLIHIYYPFVSNPTKFYEKHIEDKT